MNWIEVEEEKRKEELITDSLIERERLVANAKQAERKDRPRGILCPLPLSFITHACCIDINLFS